MPKRVISKWGGKISKAEPKNIVVPKKPVKKAKKLAKKTTKKTKKKTKK